MSKEYQEVQVEKWVNLEDVAEHQSRYVTGKKVVT